MRQHAVLLFTVTFLWQRNEKVGLMVLSLGQAKFSLLSYGDGQVTDNLHVVG